VKSAIAILFTASIVLALSACGTRSLVVLIPDPDGNVGQVVVANEGGQQVLNEANQSVRVTDRKTPPGEVTKLNPGEISSVFADVLAAQPPQPARFILYFVNDSTELVRESKSLVPHIIQTIRKRGSVDIVISGHTDTVATKTHNHKLGLKRAKALHDILLANGVAAASISVTSHGEGNPLIKTADNVAEPRNRRVEIVIR